MKSFSPILEKIIICSDPSSDPTRKECLWRNELEKIDGCKIININKNPKDREPYIPKIISGPQKQKVLLITGQHGNSNSEIYNELHINIWKAWTKEHKNKIKFDIIIIDLCDSAYLLSANLTELLKPNGVIVSSIATCDGIRSALIESGMGTINLINEALKNLIEKQQELFSGSNISFSKKKNVSSLFRLFYTESTQLTYNQSLPGLDKREKREEKQYRKNTFKKLKNHNIELKKDKNLAEYPTSTKMRSTLKQEKLDWIKVSSLFALSATVIGLGLKFIKNNQESNIKSSIN